MLSVSLGRCLRLLNIFKIFMTSGEKFCLLTSEKTRRGRWNKHPFVPLKALGFGSVLFKTGAIKKENNSNRDMVCILQLIYGVSPPSQ